MYAGHILLAYTPGVNAGFVACMPAEKTRGMHGREAYSYACHMPGIHDRHTCQAYIPAIFRQKWPESIVGQAYNMLGAYA